MRDAVREMGEVQARIGVNTGDVLTRDPTQGESLVVGGDIILNVAGIEVTGANMAKIRDALNQLRSGEPFNVTVLRAGQLLELNGRVP